MDEKRQVEKIFALVLLAASIIAKNTWSIKEAKKAAKEILSDEEKPRGL